MSIFSKIAHVVEAPFKGAAHLVTDPGKALGNIGTSVKDAVSNPLVDAGLSLALPGIGSAVGGALSAIPGASAIGGALSHIPGATALGSILGLGGQGAATPTSGLPPIYDETGQLIPNPGGAGSAPGGTSGSGILGGIGGFLGGNGGKNALGAASAVSSYLNQQKANDYAKNALSSVEDSYNQRAPLRAQGLSSILQSQAGNPYATGKANTLPVRG